MSVRHKICRTIFIFLIAFSVAGFSGLSKVWAETDIYGDQQELVDKARITIDSFIADPNLEWFRNNVRNARGLLIVPELLKGGFILGGSGGRGVFLLRDSASGQWSGPAFYMVGSVSVGLQIGGKISEVVMMVMTQKGVESLYASSFKIGGDISIAAGPVGATAEGATAPSLNVDYISFARSKGIFAGISLDGSVIKTDSEWNRAYYGQPVLPADILVTRSVENSKAESLRQAVARALQPAVPEGILEQEKVLETNQPLEQEEVQGKPESIDENAGTSAVEDKKSLIKRIQERYRQEK